MIKITKKIFPLLTAYTLIFTAAYAKLETAKFVVPGGLPEMTITEMKKESTVDSTKMNYIVEKNSDSLINSILKNEPDFAVVPSNLAEKINENKLDYYLLGTVGWGSFYVVGYKEAKDIKELNGKKIVMNGKGLTPDLVTKNIFKKSGVKEANVDYLASPAEVSMFLLSKKYEYAILPEPNVTQVLEKNKDLKVLFNMNDEWKKVEKNKLGYPQSIIIVKKSVYDKEKESVDKIINRYKESIDYLVKNSKADIYKTWNLNDKSIERLNINFKNAKETKEEYKQYMNVLKEGATINESVFK